MLCRLVQSILPQMNIQKIKPYNHNYVMNIQKIKPYNHNYVMNFDGYSTGNPIATCGSGVIIYNNNTEIWKGIWSGTCFTEQNKSNTLSEYTGLIYGLQQAKKLNIKNLLIRSSSEIIINQMNEQNICISKNIFDLFIKCKELETDFDNIKYQYINKKLNKYAYKLAILAVENALILK